MKNGKRLFGNGVVKQLDKISDSHLLGELPKQKPVVSGAAKNSPLIAAQANADWARGDHRQKRKAWA